MAARRLNVPPRTLAYWRSRDRVESDYDYALRGRPPLQSSYEKRHAALEVIRDVGPHVGLPTLTSLLPDMPRAELSDLRTDYRVGYRARNRVLVQQLTWHAPGTVWAMDHAEPPLDLEDPHHAIFAVRDLASGMQPAWLPVEDQTADTILPVLARLFATHGAPLVLKSDNGSAFIERSLGSLLEEHRVVHLFSPPETPSYNGACEAGIGGMKIRTAYLAARRGREDRWSADDLDAARRQADEVHRATFGAPTAAERWATRAPIDDGARQTLREAIDRHRNELVASLERKKSCTTAPEEATIERIAIRRALVGLGILSLKPRLITLPIKANNLAKI